MTRRREHRSRPHDSYDMEKLARGLGWFSLALGAVELFGARSVARWLRMERHETLIRAYGAREVATGIGILMQKDPTPWIWGRVAGDALDLATLGTGMPANGEARGRVALAAGAVAGVTLLDIACANALTQGSQRVEWHRDYSDRSGFPRSPQQMRGAARDFEVPRDLRIPDALRPYKEPLPQGYPRPPV